MTTRPLARAAKLITWIVITIVVLGLIVLSGVGIVALLGQDGSDQTWSRWGNVGDAFGALNSLLSGVAVAAIVVTFLVQFQELKVQRNDIARQRESLDRTAEANLRDLHVNLMKMAMDDKDLAAVWPPLAAGLSEEENKQYLYANLILQHARILWRTSAFTDVEMHSHLHHVFTSPIMREYWRISRPFRHRILVPGTAEYRFNEVADTVRREHEDVLEETPTEPPPVSRPECPPVRPRVSPG